MKPLERLGRNIRVRRTEKGLTQYALADDAGIGQAYIGGIERGERNPSATTLIKLARALDCSVDELLKGVELDHDDDQP